MRILWLATKLPWPPMDGGRLVAQLTLEALAERGHDLVVLAPSEDREAIALSKRRLESLGARLEVVAAGPRPRLVDALATPFSRRPWTIRRHAHGAVRRRARELVAELDFDLVHAEQAQAFYAAEGLGLPVVLRAQNVESDLWRKLSFRRPRLAPFLRLEARRLAAYEALAIDQASATVALTAEDAKRLRDLAATREGSARERISVLEAPFPSELPSKDRPLGGTPALVLFGSPSWWPNKDGAQWFMDQAWPEIHVRHPQARLHVFGFDPKGAPACVVHGAPAESAEALPVGSILLVPLFVSSGVRMKILEAWARGVPVIASPAAARGLGARDGKELCIAEETSAWAEAVTRIEANRQSFIDAARRALTRHAPPRVAEELETIYRRCVGTLG